MELFIKRLDEGLPVPARAHPGDAGLDLYSAADVTLKPGERASVPTGIALAIPFGYVGLVTPRSGLARKHGLGMVNTPGVIDAGYRGEVMLLLMNLDPHEAIELKRGERVAQLLLVRAEAMPVVEVETLPESSRGEGGFGSTGR
jgi:dUTP pyrophosphatase